MKLLQLCSIVLLLASCGRARETETAAPPNIIYILADDLGYGELGAYGQQVIETPNLDALATGGMRFTQHYSGAPVCAPARCILLTGQHAGHALVRGNDEDGSRGDVWNFQAMFDDPRLEGQRPIPDSLVTLGEVLQKAGYTTGPARGSIISTATTASGRPTTFTRRTCGKTSRGYIWTTNCRHPTCSTSRHQRKRTPLSSTSFYNKTTPRS